MTRRLMWLLLLFVLLFSSGCETMGGFGRDLQNFGGWIEKNSH